MRQSSGTIALTVMLALIGLLLACAGPQSGSESAVSNVKQETLPAAPPASPPKPAQPEARQAQTGPGTVTPDRSDMIKFMYEDVYFKRGSIKLDSNAKMLLDKKARWMEANPEISVVIEGHTDYRGSKEFNLALGDRRAGAVKSYLIRKGIARERLMAISYGREKPAVQGKTEKDRARNRRVHFVIERQ